MWPTMWTMGGTLVDIQVHRTWPLYSVAAKKLQKGRKCGKALISGMLHATWTFLHKNANTTNGLWTSFESFVIHELDLEGLETTNGFSYK